MPVFCMTRAIGGGGEGDELLARPEGFEPPTLRSEV